MQAALYSFLIDHFDVVTARSGLTDTDWVAGTLTVNGFEVASQSKRIGDVDFPKYDVKVGIQLDAVAGIPDARVDFAFLIQNLGYKGSAEDQSNTALDWVSSKCKDIITAAFGFAKVWDTVDSIIQDINKAIFADCDGPVAADKQSWNGSQLADAVAAHPGRILPFNQTYLGKDSPIFCGSNSKYNVSCSVTQKAIGDIVWIVNRATDKRLQIHKGSVADGVLVQQYKSDRSMFQAWIASPTADGYMQFVNTQTGKLMDVPGGATANGIPIQQYHENGGGANQQWRLIPTDSGFVKIQSRATGKLLDINGSSMADGLTLQQWDDNGGGANQQWLMIPVGVQVAPPGVLEAH